MRHYQCCYSYALPSRHACFSVCICVLLVPSTKALMMTPDIVVPTKKRRIT